MSTPWDISIAGSSGGPVRLAGVATGEPAGGSQPSVPTDIPNCVLWLDASTLSLADDDPVASWPDSSDSGFDAAQADTDLQPTFKTNIIGNKSVVRFESTNGAGSFEEFLACAGALDVLRDVNGATVAFVVANPATADTNYVLSVTKGAGGAGGARRLMAEYHGDGPVIVNGGNDDIAAYWIADIQGGGTTTLSGRPRVAVAVGALDYALGLCTIALTTPSDSNGMDVNDAAVLGPTPDTPSDAVYIGLSAAAANGSDLDIAAVVLYDRALSALERRQLAELLSTAWGVL